MTTETNEGITLDWLLGIVASNPTPAIIVKAMQAAYALGQRDCVREMASRPIAEKQVAA